MKTKWMGLLITVALSIPSMAINIPVIDIENGPTIQSEGQVPLDDLSGKKLSYRGAPQEVLQLFKRLVSHSKQNFREIIYEIHPQTNTLAIRLSHQNKTLQWVIPRTGD